MRKFYTIFLCLILPILANAQLTQSSVTGGGNYSIEGAFTLIAYDPLTGLTTIDLEYTESYQNFAIDQIVGWGYYVEGAIVPTPTFYWGAQTSQNDTVSVTDVMTLPITCYAANGNTVIFTQADVDLLSLPPPDPSEGDYEEPDAPDVNNAPEPVAPPEAPVNNTSDLATTGDIERLRAENRSLTHDTNQHNTDLFNALFDNLNAQVQSNRDVLIDIVQEVDSEGDQTQSLIEDTNALIQGDAAEDVDELDMTFTEDFTFDDTTGRIDSIITSIEGFFPDTTNFPTVSGRQYQYDFFMDFMGVPLDFSFSLTAYQQTIEMLRAFMKAVILFLSLLHFIATIKSAFAN